MIRHLVVLLISFLLILPATPGLSAEIGGVKLPEKLKAGDAELVLNGAGLRKKFFIKVYAGGLYLPEKMSDPKAIIAAEKPMAIRMHFIYDGVSAEKLVEAFNEGFENAFKENPSAKEGMKDRIAAFNALFDKEAKEGDLYDLVYLPNRGVTVFQNNAERGTVQGLDFKRALFAVWLGDEPADDGLKEGMLGE